MAMFRVTYSITMPNGTIKEASIDTDVPFRTAPGETNFDFLLRATDSPNAILAGKKNTSAANYTAVFLAKHSGGIVTVCQCVRIP